MNMDPRRTTPYLAARPRRGTPAAVLLALVLALTPNAAAAQDGAGSAGAQVLQLTVGARAASLSGAYTAAGGDADVLFYNPAGLATLDLAGALSYERYVEDIGLGSAAAAMRVGPVVVGAGAAFLDAGSIDVIEPDPAYGGQRGSPTGQTVGASETAVRLSAALPLGRLSVGAGAGLVSSDIAGSGRSGALVDVGARYELSPALSVGAAVRNLGGEMDGDPMPTEARLGAVAELGGFGPGMGLLATGDLVARLNEGGAGVVLGLEGGLLPRAAGELGAVARVGYDAAAGDGGLGAFRLGAGLSLGNLALDYAYRSLDFFGATHRIGVRWSRGS